MLTEAKKLHKSGLSWKRMLELGLEYKYMALHLKGEISREYMVEELNQVIWKYAKRQRTWFKRDDNIKWFNLDKNRKNKKLAVERVIKYVAKQLKT